MLVKKIKVKSKLIPLTLDAFVFIILIKLKKELVFKQRKMACYLSVDVMRWLGGGGGGY